MPDNVTFGAGNNATPPNATVAATEELVDGSHAGIANLRVSDSDARTLIPATAADGLLVNLGTNNDVTTDGLTDAELRATPVDVTVATSLPGGTNNIGDVDVVSVPAPLSTTGGGSEAAALRVTLANDSTGLVSVDDNGGSLTVDNGGTFAVQESGGALTALQLIDDAIIADDATFTPATTKVMMAGFAADETATDSVDEGDGGAARMTLDRKVIVTPQPHAAGGLDIFRSLDLDESEEEVKASAGTVYGWAVTNTATSTRWIKFYNATAANVVVGTTVPVITWGIPGNSSDDVAANALGGVGIKFDTAICVAATTGLLDSDTGAPAANDVIVNIFYK